MEIKEITKLMNMAESTEEIQEAREKLESLVLKKNENSRKKSELQRQLDELFSQVIQSEEEDPGLFKKIQEVKGRLEVEKAAPGKIDREIEAQEEEIRRLEWTHYQEVKEAAPEAVKPVVERYLNIMTEARELEQEIRRADKAVNKAIPQYNDHDRVRAAMCSGAGISKPVTVTDKRIERFEEKAKKRGIIA